jgi:hypothetical protein
MRQGRVPGSVMGCERQLIIEEIARRLRIAIPLWYRNAVRQAGSAWMVTVYQRGLLYPSLGSVEAWPHQIVTAARDTSGDLHLHAHAYDDPDVIARVVDIISVSAWHHCRWKRLRWLSYLAYLPPIAWLVNRTPHPEAWWDH